MRVRGHVHHKHLEKIVKLIGVLWCIILRHLSHIILCKYQIQNNNAVYKSNHPNRRAPPITYRYIDHCEAYL